MSGPVGSVSVCTLKGKASILDPNGVVSNRFLETVAHGNHGNCYSLHETQTMRQYYW